jgi:hypothetical protein
MILRAYMEYFLKQHLLLLVAVVLCLSEVPTNFSKLTFRLDEIRLQMIEEITFYQIPQHLYVYLYMHTKVILIQSSNTHTTNFPMSNICVTKTNP